MARSLFIALLALGMLGCQDKPDAPPEPQSTVATPESIRRPGQAVDPLERAKGVEQEVLDGKKANDEAIEAGGG